MLENPAATYTFGHAFLGDAQLTTLRDQLSAMLSWTTADAADAGVIRRHVLEDAAAARTIASGNRAFDRTERHRASDPTEGLQTGPVRYDRSEISPAHLTRSWGRAGMNESRSTERRVDGLVDVAYKMSEVASDAAKLQAYKDKAQTALWLLDAFFSGTRPTGRAISGTILARCVRLKRFRARPSPF